VNPFRRSRVAESGSKEIFVTVDARRFSAHCTDEARVHAHAVPEAASFLDAAVMFAERWTSGEDEVSVTVVDCETGEQQCFRIDLDSGDAKPC
jgi:hypothetical protein